MNRAAQFVIGLCFLFSLITVKAEVKIAFSESKLDTYLKAVEKSHGSLSDINLGTVLTSLLNIEAVSAVDSIASAKVAEIVQPSPFNKPAAVAAFIMPGLPEGFITEGLTMAQAQAAVQKESLLEALAGVSASPAVEHSSLDVSNLAGCGDICLEATLQEAILGLGLNANYTQGSRPMRGQLLVQATPKSGETRFDLSNVADRLFAIELATTWRTVLDHAIERKRREIQDPESYKAPQLLERVFISVQALRDTYGPESLQHESACCLIHQLVHMAVQELQQVYDDRMVVIIATMDTSEMANGAKDTVRLLDWSQRSQRPTRSLLAAANASTEENYIQGFVAWIAMWGTFFLLLFFAFSGCHCLKGMKFKQDSLLYGKGTKTD